MSRSWIHLLIAFLVGCVGASAVWSLRPAGPVVVTKEAGTHKEERGDDQALRAANANLTASLEECDRKVAELRGGGSIAPAASGQQEGPRARDGGRGGRRPAGEPSREDWERMAQLGTVRVRIPCLRDTPWTPNQRVVDRLGLAPQDTKALQEAYERSNKRVMDQVRPLCAKVLGSDGAADKVGASGCIDAISNNARKASPGDTRDALVRVAEVQASKRPAPKQGSELPPIEQLALTLTNESKAFEDDLAQKMGPEDAKRVAWAPELCAERRTLRAGEEREER